MRLTELLNKKGGKSKIDRNQLLLLFTCRKETKLLLDKTKKLKFSDCIKGIVVEK